MEQVGWAVQRVSAPETYVLRQRVLRPHQSVSELNVAGEDDPDTAHFAVRDGDGQVIGVVMVLREPPTASTLAEAEAGPTDPDSWWRLRAMATDDEYRRQGVGAALVAAALAHVGRQGGRALWCNARMPAAAFYRRAGFEPLGEPWEEPVIGPHIVMWRRVPPA